MGYWTLSPTPNCTLMDGTAIQLNIGDLNTDQVIADFDLAFERLSQEVCGLIRDALFTGLVGVPISDPGVVLMAEPADSCHLPKSESRPIRRVRTAQDVLTVVQPLLMRESLGA